MTKTLSLRLCRPIPMELAIIDCEHAGEWLHGVPRM